jgi:long-chain acyl-CoA synthetase
LSPEQLEQTYWAAWVGATRRNPFTRLASRLARTVPIDPKRGVISSLAFGAAVLQRDGILVWFPEGQRSVSGELQPFRPGLGMLLRRHRVPVVPAHLNGTYEALTPGTKRLRRHPVSIRFGEALDPAELKRRGRGENAAEKIVDALHEVIARMGQREDNGERNGQESEGDG